MCYERRRKLNKQDREKVGLPRARFMCFGTTKIDVLKIKLDTGAISGFILSSD